MVDIAIRRLVKDCVKNCINGVSLVCAAPIAAASGFGRIKAAYTFFSHFCALLPGGPGDYLRRAYYHLTLNAFPMSSRISFGSFFSHSDARVGCNVYIGSYCVLGKVDIGAGTQIASGVQILSGQHQHVRDPSGAVFHKGEFVMVTIGLDCWIGAAAVVMARVGDRSTIGAGSVVTREIPSDSVAVGSPARVIRTTEAISR